MLVFPKTVNIQHGKTIHRRATAVKSKKIPLKSKLIFK